MNEPSVSVRSLKKSFSGRTVVELRSRGILRRMYCSPCSPARLLACDTICSGVMAVISTLILREALNKQSGGGFTCSFSCCPPRCWPSSRPSGVGMPGNCRRFR